MLLDVLILLIVIIRLDTSYASDEGYEANNFEEKVEEHNGTPAPCGQYGFRCLDNKRFQICPFRDSSGTTEEPDTIHECKDGFECDEDNPAYCTPLDGQITTVKYEDKNFEYYDSPSFNDDIDNFYPEIELPEREARSLHDCECQTQQPTTTMEPTTTEAEYFTTLPPQLTDKPFDCDHYGFFSDYDNKTLFWYCDVPPSGEGYLLRHMICGSGRIFDPYKHACVLPGTIRETRTNADEEKSCKTCQIPSTGKFTCKGKAPGKYADDTDCQLYHVCLTNNFAPVRELLFSCPENMAFDPSSNRCSSQARKRCMNKSGAIQQVINKVGSKCSSGITCKTPSRFRDLRDCGGYYLCYGDQLLEMRCPEFYKFDDSILECLPQGIAKCHESFD